MSQFTLAAHRRLQSLASVPGLSRELAYILAGFLVVIRIFRPRQATKPASAATLALAALMLVVILSAAGPVLGAMSPIFWAMGHLPGAVFIAAVLVMLVLRLRRLGRLFLSTQ